MKRLFLAGATALALAGCASIATDAERVDTTALQIYATIGSNLDAFETGKCGSKTCDATAEAYRLKAWNALAAEHEAYKSGVVGDLTALQALLPASTKPD
jgi:uncharacterized low-complexity protein